MFSDKELNIEKQWIEMDNPKKLWLISTLIGILIYLFFTLILSWSYVNYFLIVIQISIQLFFILSLLKERFTIKQNFIEYQFLFICKKHKFDYFLVQKSETDKFDSLSNTKLYNRIVFYRNDKPIISINDDYWYNSFRKILDFLRENYDEYELEEIHQEDLKNNYWITSLFLITLILSVFGIGLYAENSEVNEIEELTTIIGHIKHQPEILKHVEKGGVYYTMPIYLSEFPSYKFTLNEKGINKIDGAKFIETDKIGTEITLVLDKYEYDISIAKTKELAYFSSHVYIMKNLRIYGIYFQENHLLDETTYKEHFSNDFYGLSLFILLCTTILWGIIIYRLFHII